MAAEDSRSLRAVTLCLLAWVLMGLVSLVYHAAGSASLPAPALRRAGLLPSVTSGDVR